MLRIIGKGQIIFDKTGDVKTLQDYTLSRYQEPLPPISEERAREQVSVINNRMKEITKAYENNSINFYNLYHLTIEKIRRFYHNLNGLAMIPTPKVYRIYTDEEYRKSYDGIIIPEPEFIELYLNAMTDISLDKDIMYEKISNLWSYSKRNVKLNELNYRISIKTRNNNQS